MKIETVKDLEAVLKVCRKHGVTQFTADGLTLHLEAVPQDKPSDAPSDKIVADTVSDEDILFWSTGGAN